jgi:tRNA 2-thiouridine synthesizing protein B
MPKSMPNGQLSSLHTFNKTAQDDYLNLKLSQAIRDGDEVILIEDGVYQCLKLFTLQNTEHDSAWPMLSKSIYALRDDALARGIPITTEGIIFVSYEEFVQLSISHKKVISWY